MSLCYGWRSAWALHRVETKLPQDLPLVPIDELLVEQVFINLLQNAVKYTAPGTPITVSAWQEDDVVLVEVADRGAGIPQGEEETIFRKFHRVAGANQAVPPGGSGLGSHDLPRHRGGAWRPDLVGAPGGPGSSLPLYVTPRGYATRTPPRRCSGLRVWLPRLRWYC